MSDELYTDIVLIALQNQKRLPKINHNIFLHNLGSIGFFKKKKQQLLKIILRKVRLCYGRCESDFKIWICD